MSLTPEVTPACGGAKAQDSQPNPRRTRTNAMALCSTQGDGACCGCCCLAWWFSCLPRCSNQAAITPLPCVCVYSYVEWVTPGNPMWREDRRERSATAGHKPSGADYMPTLDSGPKISLATAVAKGPRRFAFVFQSNQPRLAPPGSVTAASRREFTPCTGPALGPGAYNPTEFRPDDPPPFRSGQQRGDVRCWGDNFDALRPRHLLKAQGSTALLDT